MVELPTAPVFWGKVLDLPMAELSLVALPVGQVSLPLVGLATGMVLSSLEGLPTALVFWDKALDLVRVFKALVAPVGLEAPLVVAPQETAFFL